MSFRERKDRFIARILTRFPSLVQRWASSRDFGRDELGNPWTPLNKPLSECRVALVTTAGVHLKEQTPFDMTNPDGDPTFREIPSGTSREQFTITHDYYDHRDADKDLNIVFPLDRLDDLASEGRIAGQAPLHLAFMGHIDGPLVEQLIHETAPDAAHRLLKAGTDCVILTPA